jgi:ADP-ribose pyrophosphatase YjhB (NUDIX family)
MVSVAFITYENKVLLFHRDNKPNIKDPDCWDVVGGHSEADEDPETTLKREIFEEISITPIDIKFLLELDDTWGEKTYVYHVSLSEEEKNGILLGNEGQEVKFFAKDEIDGLKLTQNLKMYLSDHKEMVDSLWQR